MEEIRITTFVMYMEFSENEKNKTVKRSEGKIMIGILKIYIYII